MNFLSFRIRTIPLLSCYSNSHEWTPVQDQKNKFMLSWKPGKVMIRKITYLLESTWSQIGQAASLLRIFPASSVPICAVNGILQRCMCTKRKNMEKTKREIIISNWIHKMWPQVVATARPSNSRQHALHLISTFSNKKTIPSYLNSITRIHVNKVITN